MKGTPGDVIVLDLEKDLRLVHIPRIRMAMDDPVSIVRERRAEIAERRTLFTFTIRKWIIAEECASGVEETTFKILTRGKNLLL